MTIFIGLKPSGRLFFTAADLTTSDRGLDKLRQLIGEGEEYRALIELAVLGKQQLLSPSLRYWSDICQYYLDARCLTPEGKVLTALEPPGLAQIHQWLNSRPPMLGAEYLNSQVLQSFWQNLDDWLREYVGAHYRDLSDFLEANASAWHRVGRVCFHLAENKSNPDYPFAFMATFSPEFKRSGNRHLPLAKALEQYAGKENRQKLVELLMPINLAAKSSEFVQHLVDSGDIYHPLAWDSQDAYRFLLQAPDLQESGLIIRLPDWWKKRPKPQVQASLGVSSTTGIGTDQILRFDLQKVLGDEELSEQQWQQLLDAEDGLTFLKGQWVEVNREKLDEAVSQMEFLDQYADEAGLSFIEGMRLLAGASKDLSANEGAESHSEWSFIRPDEALSKMLHQIRHPESLKLALPKLGSNGHLRPYQEVGVRWLWYLSQLRLGACLADDMGLGKTIQVISLLLIFKKAKVSNSSLLVLPTSLLGNWQAELEKFAPSLKVMFLHPAINKKATLEKASVNPEILDDYDLTVTSYGMLLRQPWLHEKQWHSVILDEAQAIKNPSSKQTKITKKLQGYCRIALTGTPVENRLSDLWSLLDFTNPGLLGTFTRFKSFAKSLDQREGERYAPLRNLVQPYILRRLKTDKSIISDLPDKTEVYAYCGLTKTQASAYQKLVVQLRKTLSSEEAGIKRRGLILSYIMQFKQLCNHPSQLTGDGDYQINKSGKFQRLLEICSEISARQEKVLVFTQFREVCNPLAQSLAEVFARPGLVLHGGVAAKKRQSLVQDFQVEEGAPFMVLSIKAGGTGLNLTAASHVIHFDRWWNPAVENQATDRAFRIGQKNNVLVHKFICKGTIEEKIDAIITSKSALANELLESAGEALLTEMSDTELMDLVSLDIESAQL